MNITVTKNQVSINTDYILNDKEYNVNKCYFTFSDEYTDDLVKKAIFVQGTSTIEMSIINNQCQIPAEVLNNGQFELRVYAYEVDGEELLLRYSPSYTTAYVRTGSYIENAESPEVITPTQFEQYMQSMNDGLNEVANVDIDAEQLDNGMSVTITNRYGENKTVYAYDGEKGEKGEIGATGNGIASITKTSTSGLTDTYTITFTNGNTTIFTVSNGKGIVSVEKTGTNLLADTYTITYNDNTTSSFVIMNGKGIASIELTSTSDLVDTYTITYNDNTTTTYNVTNGNGILSIEKTGTVDNVDTYTIYYTNGTTSTFTVTNSTVTDQEFETLEAEVNKYKTLSLLLPKVTGEGSSIELNDTVEGVTIDITPEGNTEQITYTGKNLFDYTTTEFSDASNVNIETSNNVVTITTTKTVTSNNLFFRTKIPDNMLKNGSTYIISSVNVSGVEKSLQLQLRNKDGSYANKIQNDYVVYDDTYSLYVTGNIFSTTSSASIPAGTTAIIKNIQVEESSTATATDYEPYVGGVPSPNPEYPQDIKVVKGNNTINIIGKNLFDKDNANVIPALLNSTTLSPRASYRTLYIPIIGGETYTISKISSTRFRVATTITTPEPNVNVDNYIQDDNATSITITTSSTANYLCVCYYITTETLTEQEILDSIQIEQGSTATTYSSYTSKTYPIYLGDIELCKIGNYKDYIYNQNGDWYLHKEIRKVVLNGSEDWRKSTASTSDWLRCYYTSTLPLGKDLDLSLCNNFTYGNVAQVNDNCFQPYNNVYYGINIKISTSIGTTADNLKTWLGTHNTIVYSALETPTNTEITDTTLINQLNNLYSAVANQDKTFIECTSTDLNNVPLIVKVSTYKDISSILNPVIEREE